MRRPASWFPESTEKLGETDEIHRTPRLIDETTYQFICFALSIKNRWKPGLP